MVERPVLVEVEREQVAGVRRRSARSSAVSPLGESRPASCSNRLRRSRRRRRGTARRSRPTARCWTARRWPCARSGPPCAAGWRHVRRGVGPQRVDHLLPVRAGATGARASSLTSRDGSRRRRSRESIGRPSTDRSNRPSTLISTHAAALRVPWRHRSGRRIEQRPRHRSASSGWPARWNCSIAVAHPDRRRRVARRLAAGDDRLRLGEPPPPTTCPATASPTARRLARWRLRRVRGRRLRAQAIDAGTDSMIEQNGQASSQPSVDSARSTMARASSGRARRGSSCRRCAAAGAWRSSTRAPAGAPAGAAASPPRRRPRRRAPRRAAATSAPRRPATRGRGAGRRPRSARRAASSRSPESSAASPISADANARRAARRCAAPCVCRSRATSMTSAYGVGP